VIPLWDANPTRRIPFVTLVLIAVNVGVWYFVQPQSETREGIEFSYEYAAIPCEIVTGQPLDEEEIGTTLFLGDETACDVGSGRADQVFPHKHVWLAVLVSMFLHGSLLHLGGNMLFLWVFGNNIEDHLGRFRYALFYVAAGVVATLAHVAVQVDSTVPLIGASGAIAGVMGAYLVWFPLAPVVTLIGIIPVPMPAFLTLGLWLVSQFFIGPDDGIAWVAHVGGFAFGVAVAFAVRESVRVRRRLWAADYRTASRGQWDNRAGPRPRPDY
jgi:rhomboid family protein